jgi:hypothetical protein
MHRPHYHITSLAVHNAQTSLAVHTYKGAILPLLSYGVPIWIAAMNYEHNRKMYVQVQPQINLCMAKAYRTTSSEALCMLTGMTPIIYRLEELAQYCTAKKRTGKFKMELDQDVEFKNWLHPADIVTIEEIKKRRGSNNISVHRRK